MSIKFRVLGGGVGGGGECRFYFYGREDFSEQWGRSDVVDPTEQPKPSLLDWGFGRMLCFFPRETAKH